MTYLPILFLEEAMRPWIALILAAGLLLAQEPPAPPQEAPKAAFDELRPTQRKFHYMLWRAALAGHELGYYQSHPKAPEVKAALEELLAAKGAALPAVEDYLRKIYDAHGLYANGVKLTLDAPWKDLQKAARTGAKGLEGRLARLKGLMLDAKVDAAAPSWAEPEVRKGKKSRSLKVPEGFAAQKGVLATWLKRAAAYADNVRAEVEVKGEKRIRSVANPELTKPIAAWVTALEGDDLALLQSAGLTQWDLRRFAAIPGADQGRLGQGILTPAPEGPVGEWKLFPLLEPVMAESKFGKGEDKRAVLSDVKLAAAPSDLMAQMALFGKLGRSKAFGTD